MKKFPIGKAEKWLVDSAKEVGLDIDGFVHEITNDFVTHVMRQHGNEKSEGNRGNVAIKESDFAKIPSLLETPDYTIVGAKRKNENILVYSKKIEDGTTLYFEEILDGKKNKTLRGKTMFKRKSDINEEILKTIIAANGKTDIARAKIVIGGGGQSPSETDNIIDPTAAASALPTDISSISQSEEKSSIVKRISNKEKNMEANEKTTEQEDGPSFLSDEFEELEKNASRMNDFLIRNVGFLPANNDEADEAVQMLKLQLKADFNLDKAEKNEYAEVIERLKSNLVNHLVNEKAEKQTDGSFYISKEKLDEIEESFESISRRDIIKKISKNNKEILKGERFYDITENKNGGYTYHEFTSGWSGTRTIETNSVFRDFDTHNKAGFYALQRGGVDAYIYKNPSEATKIANEHKPTNEETAANQKQSESPSLERRNINSKENFMSEQQNNGEWTIRPPENPAEEVAKNQAFINMRHQRKMVLEGLRNGTLSCLPGADGFADTRPAVNLVQGTEYHDVNLLDLKDHQKKNGFPTAEYVSDQQLKDAKKDYPGLSPKPNENGISLHWEKKNKETGEYERESVYLFNIAQTTNPEAVKEYAVLKQQEDAQKYYEIMKEKYPGWEPKEPKQKGPGPVIECSSTEPEKYLGQYFAAVSTGGKFKATPEQSAEFAKNMETALAQTKVYNGTEREDISVLPKINREASQLRKDLEKYSSMQREREQYKEQQQEQTQSRGRGM